MALLKMVKLGMHAMLVGSVTKLGVSRPPECQAFSLFVPVHISSPVPTTSVGIEAILISGLKIRLTWGDGSMPAWWQFDSERIVSHCRTPSCRSRIALSTQSCLATELPKSETMRLWVLLLGVFLFSGGACRLGLARQFVCSLPIASREVKWN